MSPLGSIPRIYHIVTITFFLANSLTASGGYSGGGINQDKGSGINANYYEIGKSIYNSKQNPSRIRKDLVEQQLRILAKIQGNLPRAEQRRVDLLRLAGSLDESELRALHHFVQIRFNVKWEYEGNE